MPIAAEQCPNCGAPLKLDAQQACVFCRAQLTVTTPEGRPDREAVARALDPNAPFAMKVDDVFVIKGRGTVATGQVGGGTIRVGDALVVESPRGRFPTRCTSIEKFRRAEKVAVAGDTVGLILEGVGKGDLQRGDWIRPA